MYSDISLFNLNLPELAEIAEQRILGWFAKDALSKKRQLLFRRLVREGTYAAGQIQCVGMPRPIDIDSIFQPTALYLQGDTTATGLLELLDNRFDAAIFARPGGGKTTLLHWAYLHILRNPNRHGTTYLPLLFTLKDDQSLGMLFDIVDMCEAGNIPELKKVIPVLFLDGYDEVSTETRKLISKSIMRFASLKCGRYYLSCRTYYTILDLHIRHYHLGGFQPKDAAAFVNVFSGLYGKSLNGEALVRELTEHHFASFTEHPFMLALVCILRTSPTMHKMPANSMALIRQALNMLTFNLDTFKGVNRESFTEFDGDDRIRCLQRVAYCSDDVSVSDEAVCKAAQEELYLMHRAAVNPRQLLLETAQFYGLLVPTEDAHWEWVHSTIHSYLGAQFWHGTGTFNLKHIKVWNLRTAYTACLRPNATDIIEHALKQPDGLFVLSECLFNNARFDSSSVAPAVVLHYEQFDQSARLIRNEKEIFATTVQDIFGLADSDFVRSVFLTSLNSKFKRDRNEVVLAYSIAELMARGERFSRPVLNQVRLHFNDDDLRITVNRKMTGVVGFRVRDVLARADSSAQHAR